MTVRLSFCVKAATTLDPDDLEALTRDIEGYRGSGVDDRQSELLAVDDLAAALEAERLAVLRIAQETYPDVFAQAAEQAQNGARERTDLRGEGQEALGTVAAEEGGRPAGSGRTGVDAADGGPAGERPGARADGPGVQAARGRGGRAGRARATTARERRGDAAVGAPGTGDAGTPAPGQVSLGFDAASAPNIPAQNFRITPDLRIGRGGEVEKFNDNLAAIRALKAIEADRRRATPDEQRMLARYVGWGGLANAFPDPITGEFKDKWKARGEELRDLLTPSEYAQARRSTRNAHYTSETVVSAMWTMARRLGFRGGLVLESSMGAGNFLGLAPQDVPATFIGVEYDGLTARIAGALYPQAAVLHTGFQKVPMADNAFALNIGNPPFGKESLRFQYKPELAGASIHNQFFRAGIDAVRPGGLQINVVSRFLMDAQDTASRAALARKARLVAAIRLPDTAFKENARTEVVTDIIILQKLTPAEQARMDQIVDAFLRQPEKKAEDERERRKLADQIPDWVRTTNVRDPLGNGAMRVNSYFAENPDQVMGVMERSGSMQPSRGDDEGPDITVRLDNPAELERMLAEATERLPEGISQIADEVLAATEERFDMLSEALRIAVAQEQPGHLKINPDGKLQRVIERESPDGGEFMARQTITPGSPWSEQLLMDDKGRWYKMEAVLGEDGKPVKAVKDGKATKRNVYERVVYEREEDVPEGLRLGQTGYAKLMGLVNMRDLLKQQLVLETEDAPTAQMEGNRKKLAEAYEKFTAEHGPVNRPANLRLAMTMPDGGLLAALEDSYQPERTAEQAKKSGLPAQSESAPSAAILRTRVVPKYEPPTSAKTAADALSITLAERGRVDMERIAELRGVTPEAAAAELQAGEKPLVFMDPESQQWETADEYLTGLVKRKLNAAQAAGMDLNVKALEAVQPEPWTAENVNVQMGATWVPPDVYARFAEHLLGGKARVTFSPLTNAFSVDVQGSDRTKAENWSTTGAPATYIIQRILNSQAVKVTYEDADGNTRVDEEATALAILKSKEIVAEFGDWVFKDGEQRRMLVDLFNEKFNTRVSRQYDGQHLTLPGKVPDAIIALRRHQKNAVWRGISSRFLLLDHVVGAGKTFTGIARAMERRRMGIARKPVIVVPNHLVEQWAIDVYRLYPGAKVLAAGQNDFEAKRRRKLFSKIATGDWDIVIVPHSSFGFIGISPDTEQRFLEAEMREANAAIEQAWEQAKEDGTAGGRRKPFGVKEAERLAEKIQARLDKLAEGARDRLLTFEQLGIDDLTVDEAHEFKNLFYSSRLSGVRGMGNKTGSRKAADLYNKVRVLREGGGAVTFMTGTPVSNSAVELYTMMRYLAADALEEQGLTHFDAWRSQYVDATPAFEPTETGRLKEVTRMGRSWSNMRSLMDLYYQFTDAVTIDDIKKWYREDNAGADFPVPKVKGGERQLVKLKPTADQERVLQEVIEGFDSLPNEPDPFERNKARLRLMDRARKVSLDVRAVDPRANATEKGGKLEAITAEVKRIYDKWTPERGTQLVFLDRSVPKAKGDDKIIKEYDALVAKREKATSEGDEAAFSEASDALEKFDPNEIEELRNAQAGGWNAYQQLKDNLVAAGVPANEIKFIQEASNDEQKQALFDAVNGGKVRVLIGSTQRMGAGTNVQKRIVALHHADVTWKPSDIEQREGRAIRQGNLLATPPTKDRPNDLYRSDFELEILAYATERTVDAKMWDLNATKLRTINGLRKYDGAFTMDIEDEESVSMAEMAALASGNPLLLERVTLESQIANMELQERAHRRKTVGAADSADSARRTIEEAPRRIAQMRERAANLAPRVEAMRTAAAARKVVVEGQEFTSLMEANRAAQAAMELQQEGNTNARYAVTIDGQRATSKDAIAEALGAALGDALPFEVTIGKKTYTQRTPAGRDAAAEINKATPRVAGEGAQVVELGTMFGFRLVVDLTPSRWSNKNEVQLDLTLMDGEKTLVSENFGSVDPGLAIPTSKMRDALGAMAQRVEAAAADDATQWLEDSITRAKRDLPGFEQRAAEPFAKADELKAKRERLKEVVAMLSDEKGLGTLQPQLRRGDGHAIYSAEEYEQKFKDKVKAEMVGRFLVATPETKRAFLFKRHPPNGFATREDAQRWVDMELQRSDAAPKLEDDEDAGDIRLSVDAATPKPDTSRYEYDGDRNHQNTVRFAMEAIGGDGGGYVLEAVKPPRSRLDLVAAAAVARDVGGHEVIFVRQPAGRRINGAAFGTGRDYLLIDVDSTRPVMAVVGHEMLHRLRAQRPELYERLLERLKGVLTGESEYADDLRAKYERAGVDLISDPDAIREELVADLFGDEWNDPAFWRELGQGQPSGWRAVVDAIAKILDEIVAAVSAKRPFGTQKYISDLRAAREAVIEATREFGAGRVGALADRDGLRLSVDGTDQTDTPAFRRWFGDSKVVDAQGKPLVVYHGTTEDFSAFDPSLRGSKTGVSDARGGFFFAASGKAASEFTWKSGDMTGSVIPAYLALNNPLRVRLPGEWAPGKYDKAMAQAKADGHDGLIVEGATTLGTQGDYYIAFRPEQIKSAIGNRGTFDPESADIRLSVEDTPPGKAMARPIHQRVRAELPNLLSDVLAGTAKSAGAKVTWWDRTIGTQYAKAQKFPGFKAVFDRAHRYLEDTSSMANEAADKARDILPKLETWKDIGKAPLSTKDAQAIAAPIFTGTLTDQKVYDDAELRDRFGLSERQIGLYRDFLEAVNTSLDQVVAADVVRLLKIEDAGMQNLAVDHRAAFRARVEAMLEDRIENGDPEAQGLLDIVRDKYMRVATLKEEGYAPLMRFGRYKVHVLDKQGQTLFFSLHESAREANERARELGEDPAYKGARFERGVLSEEQYKLFNQVPIDSLEMFAEAVGAEKSAIFQEFIKLAKNNRSALKRLIHRKGTAGFAEDVPRVLAAFVTSNARLASGAMNLPAAKEAAESIREGDVKDEAIKLVDAIENPREVAGAARGLMFMNFIGGSIASALVNITQPVTMTLPYLSQWGGGVKAAGRLMEAGRIAARGTGGSVDLRAALMRAEREGIVSPQEIHHLTAQAMSTWGKHPALQKLAFVWGAPFSLAEQFNRRVSFIAAYQTAKDEGIENPFAFAEKSVIETQGLYSKANAPNWARNPVGAVALTFKQFSIHYMEWMGRMYRSGPEGKKAVLLALALLVLAAGVDGLPFAADIDDLVDTIGQAAGYDMNAKRWRRELLADAFGDEWADVIARGGSAAAGVPFDISLRMSMGNMVPGSGLLLRSSTDRTNDVLEIAGPAGGLAKQYLESGRKALAGDFAQAALGLAPVAIQNLGKAAQMWSTGEARDALGRKIMDTDEVDAAARFLGFNPSVVARESEKLGMIRRSEQLAKNVEGEIAGRWARALADGDSEGVAEARAELAEWNEANPQQRIVITQRQLRSRVKALRLERAQRFITSASPERRQQVREALEDGR